MGNKIHIRIHILLILMVLLAVGTALWNLDIETGDNTGKFNLCQNFDRKSNAYLICKLFKNGSLSPHEVEGMLEQCVEFPKWPRMREMPWSKHYSPQNNKAMRMSHRSLKHTEGCFAISKDPVKPIESITLEELILLARATTQAVAYSVILLLLYYLKHNSTGAMKHRKYKTDGSTRIKMRVIVSVEGLFLKGRKSVKFEHVFYDHDKAAIKGMKYGNNGKFDWLFQVFEDGWRNVGEYIVYSVFQRLASFRPLCDSELSVSPIQLANAGFRYMSEKSVYECEGCGNEVRMDGFTSQPTDPLYHKSNCQYMKSNSEELTSAQRAHEATDNMEEDISTSTSSADVTIQATEVRADTSNYADSLHTEEVASNNDNEEVVYGATAAAPPSSGYFVTCFRCGHGLSSLKEFGEHHKHRPSCSYLQKEIGGNDIADPPINTERTYEDVANHGNSARSQTTSQDNMGPNNGGEVLTDLGQPSYPEHSRSRPRLDSFSEWSYAHMQDRFTLIEAGYLDAASSANLQRPAVISEVMTIRLDEGNPVMHEIPQRNIAYENE